MMPTATGTRLPRLSSLLAVSCLGTAAALLGGRALLDLRPALTPLTAAPTLERVRRWSPDPERRREASLLLASRPDGQADPGRELRLLAGQGWGRDALAAVVLKRQAQARAKLDGSAAAEGLWRRLQRRFPDQPVTADALYALGRQQPALRTELLRAFPAHPAALAAALEAGPDPAQRLRGALHLAHWGARWPGADARLREACGQGAGGLSPAQRAQLATGLAELGDGEAAVACLSGGGSEVNAALSADHRLILARTLLKGSPERRAQALMLLSGIASRWPQSPEAEEAVRLLSQQEGPEVTAALQKLPPRWRESPPVLAHQALAPAPNGTGIDPLALLRRWPDDPASWDLQWELARRSLLGADWSGAERLLLTLPPERLPPALAARQRFWLGYVQRQLGRDEAATTTWRELRLHHPGGYYGWRAAVQLGEGDLALGPARRPGTVPGGLTAAAWDPLASGDAALDRLWRLGQTTEAWEVWRSRRGSRTPRGAPELLVEGRLRQGVGDDWTGLGQLEKASLNLPPDRCSLMPQLERSLHPRRFEEAFQPAAEREQLAEDLLLGVAKQESRFTPAVRSSVGAVGLMQLMPETAAELAGRPLSGGELEDPRQNAALGARYLRNLLQQWNGDPLLAVASYNAGPGAVQGWIADPRLRSAPELWVEAIPFPETRLYVKKVLGNAWSYQGERRPSC